MINIPLPQIKEKILEEAGITEEELGKKIKDKLDQLSGLISEEGAAHIIANEMGVRLMPSSGKLEIKNIVSGMRDVEVVGKVARVYEVREFNKGDRSGKVANFMLADDTGTVRIVLWNDQAELLEKMEQGDVVEIKSGYVRDNRGRPEIHLNDNSNLNINPDGVEVDVDISDIGPSRKKLVDLEETDDNVEVLATIVQAFEPRFFEVCPGCGKRARESGDAYECVTHGNVNEPDYAYVMNIFLDDGSDNVRTVLWRNSVQALLDMKDPEIQKFRENPADFEELKNDLLGNIVKVKGRVQRNEGYDRLELVANYIERNPDPEKEMKNLEKEAKEESAETKETTEESPNAKVETKVKAEKKEAPVEETLDTEDEDLPSIDEL